MGVETCCATGLNAPILPPLLKCRRDLALTTGTYATFRFGDPDGGMVKWTIPKSGTVNFTSP